MTELKPLSKKHQRVLDEFLVCFNQTKAYQTVYPKTTYDSAKALASNLFTDVNFSAHVAARMNEATMTADEALSRLSEMARGDLGEFTNNFGGVDWVTARKKGLTKLVKKWKVKTVTINGKDEDKEITTEEIELHDPQAAIVNILKVHGKFKELGDKENPINLNIKITKASDGS